MPFTDEQPFLDAIFARYHDDGPRLVYADFLDEAGDPERAELVRIQVALARMTEDHPRRPELANRQAGLLETHSPRWTEHVDGLVAGVDFRRGVMDSVVVDADQFLSNAEELFQRIRLRGVRLLDCSPVLDKLIQSPLLSRVRELDLCGNELGNAGVNLLARSAFLKELETLDLGVNGLDDSGVVALARASTIPGLTSLSLSGNEEITSVGVMGLAESPFFTGLTTLDLSGNDVDHVGMEAIVTSKSLMRLHGLRLGGNHVGDVGAGVLAESALLKRMLARSPHLELRANQIGPVGAIALAGSPALGRCVTLDLIGNEIGSDGFVGVFGSPHLQNLRFLKLGRNQITDGGISATRGTLQQWFARLQLLDLSENRLTRYGIGILEAARAGRDVTLDVSRNVQTASGEMPVCVAELMPGVLSDVTGLAEAAELRRRVAHPTMRPGERPNSPG